LNILLTFRWLIAIKAGDAEHSCLLQTDVYGNILAVTVIDEANKAGGLPTTTERDLAFRWNPIGVDEGPTTAELHPDATIVLGYLSEARYLIGGQNHRSVCGPLRYRHIPCGTDHAWFMMPGHVFPGELKAVGRRNPIWQCDLLYRGFGVLGSEGTTRAGIETAAIAEADY
jgi:hypothetical protein